MKGVFDTTSALLFLVETHFREKLEVFEQGVNSGAYEQLCHALDLVEELRRFGLQEHNSNFYDDGFLDDLDPVYDLPKSFSRYARVLPSDLSSAINSCYQLVSSKGVSKTAVALGVSKDYSLFLTSELSKNNYHAILLGTRVVPAKLIEQDKESNLALLMTPKIRGLTSISHIAHESEVDENTLIFTCGYNQRKITGKIGSIEEMSSEFYFTTCLLDKGFGGSPAFVFENGKPKLLGVNLEGRFGRVVRGTKNYLQTLALSKQSEGS